MSMTIDEAAGLSVFRHGPETDHERSRLADAARRVWDAIPATERKELSDGWLKRGCLVMFVGKPALMPSIEIKSESLPPGVKPIVMLRTMTLFEAAAT